MDKWLHGHSFKILLVEKMNFIFFFFMFAFEAD